MSLDEGNYQARQFRANDRPFHDDEQPTDPTPPARRAALEALEREFRDLLARNA